MLARQADQPLGRMPPATRDGGLGRSWGLGGRGACGGCWLLQDEVGLVEWLLADGVPLGGC